MALDFQTVEELDLKNPKHVVASSDDDDIEDGDELDSDELDEEFLDDEGGSDEDEEEEI